MIDLYKDQFVSVKIISLSFHRLPTSVSKSIILYFRIWDVILEFVDKLNKLECYVYDLCL